MAMLLFLFALDLSKASGDVESVKELIPGKRQIIHIRDWHLVPKESFSLDTGLTGKELDDAYAKHVENVAAVQRSIRGLLVDVREVYVEGLSDRSLPIFQAELRTLRPFHRVVSQFDPETGPETKKILEEHKLTMLRLGAAGQLALEEKLVVLPAEGKEYETANPLKRGKVAREGANTPSPSAPLARSRLSARACITTACSIGGASLASHVSSGRRCCCTSRHAD